MSDLLRDARQLRQKLYSLEVLLEIEKGERRGSRSASPSAERAAAIRRLTESGLIEAAATPARFRLTVEGREFLKEVRAKVGAGGPLDWTHADEIDFSKL
jgi:hypothetical protein